MKKKEEEEEENLVLKEGGRSILHLDTRVFALNSLLSSSAFCIAIITSASTTLTKCE